MKVNSMESSGEAPPPEAVEKVAGEFARRHGIPPGHTVTAVWVDEAGIREINEKFFGCGDVTDVISVNIEEEFAPGEYLWGEVYTCSEVARKEAARRGIPWEEEALFYFVHGLLHLAGREDVTMEERKKMWEDQVRILRACGFPCCGFFKDEDVWKPRES